MEKKLVSRIGAFLAALLLLFVSPTSIWAENVTPADGCWKTVEGDGYLIRASATDAGYVAEIAIRHASSTEDLTKKALQAIADKHVTKRSMLFIGDWNEKIKIDKSVLEALKEKDMTLDVSSGERRGEFSTDTYWRLNKIDNTVADFIPVVTTNVSNADMNKKLIDGGITCKTTQFVVNGTGHLPGTAWVIFSDKEGVLKLEACHKGKDAFIYYYNASKGVFELQTGWSRVYSWNKEHGWDDDKNVGRVDIEGIEKCGTYLISDEPLPDSMTTGKTVTVDTSGVTSTKALEDAIKDRITSAEKGSIVNVAIPAGTIVTDKIFEEASKNGVKLTVTSSNGTYVSWAFAEIKNLVNFDPTVSVGTASKDVEQKLDSVALPSSLRYTPVHFAFEGNLPGEAEVTLDLSGCGKFEEGATVYLYYYNPETKLFEKVDSSSFCNGFATFKMTHCSDYIITNEELTGELVGDPVTPNSQSNVTSNTAPTVGAAPKTGDGANVEWYFIFMLAGIAVLLAYFHRRKRA